MPRFARASSPVDLSTSDSLLALVAGVAARVARAQAVDDVLPAVLEETRAAFDAEECTLWRPNGAKLPTVWRTGAGERGGEGGSVAEPVTLTAPLLDLEAAGAGVAAVTVRFGDRDLAVLSLKLAGTLSNDERIALRAVADALAPLLASDVTKTSSDALPAVASDDRRFIQKIIDTLPIGIYVIDREYRIQAWNRKRETGLQGVSREEAVGRTIFEILHRQSAATLRAEFDEVFSKGRLWQTEVETLAGADQRTYRLSKIPMRMHDGVVTHVITVGEDVTEEKRAQERLGRAEKLAAVGQLAAGVMHEINNPLATIGVCADGISRKLGASGIELNARKSVEDKLALIWQEVERCRGIANRLLDFSRPTPLIKSRVDLHQLLDRTLVLMEHQPRFRGVEVVRTFDSKRHMNVTGETESLIQVFMALLLNAADAMESSEKRRVTITTQTTKDPREAAVEIADEGSGISRADMSRLFEPFFTTKAPGKGTGLGLSICYGIISDHKGRIDVESTLGKGSIFRVMLPLEDEA